MLLIKRPQKRLTVSLKREKFIILNSFFKPKIVRRIAVFKCFLWVRLWLWHMSSIVNCWCWVAMTLMRVSLCLKCWPFFVHFCRIEFYICVAILSFRERENGGFWRHKGREIQSLTESNLFKSFSEALRCAKMRLKKVKQFGTTWWVPVFFFKYCITPPYNPIPTPPHTTSWGFSENRVANTILCYNFPIKQI